MKPLIIAILFIQATTAHFLDFLLGYRLNLVNDAIDIFSVISNDGRKIPNGQYRHTHKFPTEDSNNSIDDDEQFGAWMDESHLRRQLFLMGLFNYRVISNSDERYFDWISRGKKGGDEKRLNILIDRGTGNKIIALEYF